MKNLFIPSRLYFYLSFKTKQNGKGKKGERGRRIRNKKRNGHGSVRFLRRDARERRLKEEGTPDVSRLPCKTIRGVHVETTTQTCLQAACNKQYDSYLHLLYATRYFLSRKGRGCIQGALRPCHAHCKHSRAGIKFCTTATPFPLCVESRIVSV